MNFTDILKGNDGDNTLHGGKGRDTFVVGKGNDLVKDFNGKKDIIQVPDSNYTIIADGKDSKISFDGTGEAESNITTVLDVNPSILGSLIQIN